MNDQSLLGLKVFNTRPEAQGRILSDSITAAGGISHDCPGVIIEPVDYNWMESLPSLEAFNQAIFTSKNAVDYSLPKFEEQCLNWPATIQVFAIGHSTANCLKSYGLNIEAIPPESTSESLLALEPFQQVDKKAILLITGEGGRQLIAETLHTRGACLNIATVYRRIPPIIHKPFKLLWNEADIDIILFTSQEAMQNIINLLKAPTWFFQKPCLVISQRLKKAATSLGFKTIIVSRPDGILNTLSQFNKGFVHDKKQKSINY